MRRAGNIALQPFPPWGGSILSLRNNCADILDSRAEESTSFAVRACGAQRRSAGAVSACPTSSIVLHASTAGKSAVRPLVLAYPVLSGAVSRLYNTVHKLIAGGTETASFEVTDGLSFLVMLAKGEKP
jgi:hypothetical protein